MGKQLGKNTSSFKTKTLSQSALAALAGTLLLHDDALAQLTDFVDISTLDGVASAELQADNTLLVTLDSGQAYSVPAGGFTDQAGQFLVPSNFLDSLPAVAAPAPAVTTGANAGLIGLGVAALGGIAAAAAGGRRR